MRLARRSRHLRRWRPRYGHTAGTAGSVLYFVRRLAIPYMKPVRPGEQSNAAAFFIPRVSAISAEVVGKSLSGVTVAQMIRSISDGSAPARRTPRAPPVARCRSAPRPAPQSGARGSRCAPGIHSSDVSTSCAMSSFVITFAGTFVPRPVMPMRGPVAEPIIALPQRSGCRRLRACRGRLPSHRRGRPGPRIASISHVSVSVSPGEKRLKRQSSMPAKNAILPLFSSSTSTATAPPGQMLTMSTPASPAARGSGRGTTSHRPAPTRRHVGRPAARTRRPGPGHPR